MICHANKTMSLDLLKDTASIEGVDDRFSKADYDAMMEWSLQWRNSALGPLYTDLELFRQAISVRLNRHSFERNKLPVPEQLLTARERETWVPSQKWAKNNCYSAWVKGFLPRRGDE